YSNGQIAQGRTISKTLVVQCKHQRRSWEVWDTQSPPGSTKFPRPDTCRYLHPCLLPAWTH
ncbi:hypothetical protein HispidOSU_031600, partial [Sigmodon hispidus]